MSLLINQLKFLDLAVNLAQDPAFSDVIAGPFVSVNALKPTLHPRIMYVGQATRGNFWLQEFLGNPNLAARQQCVAEALQERGLNDRNGFWRFARLLADLADVDHSGPHVDNIVWSNIIRIGDRRGNNPRSALGHSQWDLLSQTLHEEVQFYKPDIIVFVTGHYWNRIILDIYSDWSGGISSADFTTGKHRPATSTTPAMLWFGHPGRRSNSLLKLWTEQVAEVLSD